MVENRPGTLAGHLQLSRDSQRPAVKIDTLTLSYAELIDLVESTGAQLRAMGVEPADRVVVMMPNCAEHIVAVLAANTAGAIAVPIDPEAGSCRLVDIVEQTRPCLCVVGMDQATLADIQTVSLHIDPARKCAQFAHGATAAVVEQIDLPLDQIAFIRFTSGSTGHAKGVVLTHAQQLWIARSLSEHFGFDTGHNELILVSMALSGGWQRVAATLYAGGCVIIANKPLSVGDLLDTLANTGATGFFTPPPLLRMLLASPADKVSDALRACKTIEIGSAAVTADELQDFVSRVPDARVYVHYGLTECSRAVILDTGRYPDRLTTVGRPAAGVDIRIVDHRGNELACNQSGQILLRGPQLTAGYWQQPDLNRQRISNGWLATGDYGAIDEAGFLTLRGRHDDLINCGGHCYFPDEVEQALGSLHGIEQYLIAGVPDPRGMLQQVPWAFVVPVDADEWSPADYLLQARRALPAYMVPRRVLTVPCLPLTPSGKPDRREAVKLYASSA